MNGQLLEYWGRTMLAAMQAQNQTGSMANWFQSAYRDMTRLNSNLFQFWGLPATTAPQGDFQNYWERTWDALLQMQQLTFQWIGMISPCESVAQSKKIAQLEEQVEEQARTIEHLQSLVDKSGEGNSEMVTQFQKLIEQQGRQFQQLTSNVGEYLKSGAAKAGTKKQS